MTPPVRMLIHGAVLGSNVEVVNPEKLAVTEDDGSGAKRGKSSK
eukprot:CAMPEP_0182481692 /NCGR_PEP_ID=MMETSP1319-20130603/37744_1 /TAXON_ID=172717 /ORGANISM="Bolidomonas pacifica, Strain RCC208" /LENGTH=43 /DNA_ID= /DNA_START= /DNA_END= /DNA_ORIENTATION=